MLKIRLQSCTFEADGGMQITYYLPDTDVKAAGVVRLQTLMVPPGAEYEDEMESARGAVSHLVRDVLDDWDSLTSLRDQEEADARAAQDRIDSE